MRKGLNGPRSPNPADGRRFATPIKSSINYAMRRGGGPTPALPCYLRSTKDDREVSQWKHYSTLCRTAKSASS